MSAETKNLEDIEPGLEEDIIEGILDQHHDDTFKITVQTVRNLLESADTPEHQSAALRAAGHLIELNLQLKTFQPAPLRRAGSRGRLRQVTEIGGSPFDEDPIVGALSSDTETMGAQILQQIVGLFRPLIESSLRNVAAPAPQPSPPPIEAINGDRPPEREAQEEDAQTE